MYLLESNFVFSARPLLNESEASDKSATILLTVQKLCRSANYTINVVFKVTSSKGTVLDNNTIAMTATNVTPGAVEYFHVNDSILKLESGQSYCYLVSLSVNKETLYSKSIIWNLHMNFTEV